MRKIVSFYKNVGMISFTVAVVEAAVGWKFHGSTGILVSLFFVGMAVACFLISNHAADIDSKIRKSFLDHLNVIEPRLDARHHPELASMARSIRTEVLRGKPIVLISQRMGVLNTEMVQAGLLGSTPLPPSHI